MKPRVYVETSVLSYLTALPSRDLVRAAHQQITIEWWAIRERFELFVFPVTNNPGYGSKGWPPPSPGDESPGYRGGAG